MPNERRDEAFVNAQARLLGEDVAELWKAITTAAREETNRVTNESDEADPDN